MASLLGTLQTGVAVAIATTFDDNIYLTGFFSEVNRRFRPLHVVVGELLGFSVLMAISLLCFALATQVPGEVTGWLGAVPILMGLRNLVSLWQARDSSESEERDYRQRFAAYHGFRSRRVGLLEVLRDRKTYSVSAVTISNGGNNLAIYIPLFTSSTLGQLALIVPICYLAVLTWLFLSYRLTRLPGIAVVLSRYANHVFPFVLMWLGFRILNDSGALAVLGKAA